MDIVEYFYSKRPDLKGKLLPEQIIMLKDLVDILIKSQALSCGRGFGKTMLSGCTALYFADEYSREIKTPITVLLISAQRQIYDRIDEFFYYDKSLKPRLRQQPGAQSGYEIPREKFQFADTMSTVYDCLPTIKQVEGIRADIIIFDESQDIPRAIYEKAIGCLKKDVIGKIIFIGTPYTDTSKGTNWFIDDIVAKAKKLGYKLSQYSSEKCNWNDVERWKHVWSKARFKAECKGEPPTKEERAFFPSKHLDDCIMVTDPIREGGPNSRLELGIDWGYPTYTVLTERIGTSRRKVLEAKEWKDTLELLGSKLLYYIAEKKPFIVKADSEPKEYRDWFTLHARDKIKFINFALGHKDQMFGQLQRMIREHRIIIPNDEVELITGLRKYRRGRGEEAKLKYGDYVDALALSTYEPAIPLESSSYGKVYFPFE